MILQFYKASVSLNGSKIEIQVDSDEFAKKWNDVISFVSFFFLPLPFMPMPPCLLFEGLCFSFFLTLYRLFRHSITTVRLRKRRQGAPCSYMVVAATVRTRSVSSRDAECMFLPWDCNRASAWCLRWKWIAWSQRCWRESDRVTNYYSLMCCVFPFHPPR